jgi:signal peptidase I
MKNHHSLSNAITTILAIIGLIVMALLFLPEKFGGRVTYLVVNGVSMEPTFHQGDLVIVRAADHYNVRDIAAYKNQELEQATVIHRIVKINNENFVFQGDNNTWVDDYKPTQAEIIGKLWLHFPGIGNGINWLKKPINLVLVVLVVGGILMIKPSRTILKKGKKVQKSPAKCVNWIEGIIIIACIAGAFCLVMAFFAYTRPLTKENNIDIPYTQTGSFSYSAVTDSDIYDNNEVVSGDPIFPKLTCQVDFSYSYQLSGIDPSNINGFQSLDIVIQDPATGWKRTIVTTPKKAITQSTYKIDNIVDICEIEDIVNNYLTTTKLKSDYFTLSVVPIVILTADVEGKPLSENFSPSLIMEFNDTHFFLRTSQTNEDPLTVSKEDSLKKTSEEINHLSILGNEFQITDLRELSVKGFTYSFALLLAGALIYIAISLYCKEASIALRYCPILVEINDPKEEIAVSGKIINVNSIEDLAKIADRDHLLIMHGKDDTNPPSDLYFVESDRCIYQFISKNNHRSKINITKMSDVSRMSENEELPIEPKSHNAIDTQESDKINEVKVEKLSEKKVRKSQNK